MFFLMLRQSFMRGRRRKVLATTTIALAASLITALMNLSIDVGDKMAKELKSYGANINVVPKSENVPLEIGGVDYNPLRGQVFIEERDLPRIKDIFWHNNIIGFAPLLKVTAEIEGTGGKAVPLLGTHFDKLVPVSGEEEFRTGVRNINPYWQVSGVWPDDNDHAGILAGAPLAREMNLRKGDHIKVNLSTPRLESRGLLEVHPEPGFPTSPSKAGLRPVERVKISGKTRKEQVFQIKGILSTGGPEESALVAPLPAVQKLAGLEGKVQSVSVSALTTPEDKLSRKARQSSDSLNSLEYDRWYCTAYVSSITHQIGEAVPNVTARPIWQVAASEGEVINKIQFLMIVVTFAAFIASGLGISSLMASTIIERSREIGLMKALGAANREVYFLFLGESVIVGLIGGMLGCAAGAGLSQVIGLSIFGSTVSFNPIVITVNVAVSVMIALVGSFMPSRLITKLYPAEVLHGRR